MKKRYNVDNADDVVEAFQNEMKNCISEKKYDIMVDTHCGGEVDMEAARRSSKIIAKSLASFSSVSSTEGEAE